MDFLGIRPMQNEARGKTVQDVYDYGAKLKQESGFLDVYGGMIADEFAPQTFQLMAYNYELLQQLSVDTLEIKNTLKAMKNQNPPAASGNSMQA